MFHSFFQFTFKVEVLILFAFFQFYSMVRRDSNVHNPASSLFFVEYHKVWSAGRDLVILCISKSQRSLCLSFSRTDSGLCIYHLFVWSNWNFLHIPQWITLVTQSCLVLYSFCANFLYSLIIDRVVSFTIDPTSAVLLHLIYSHSDTASPYGVVLCWYWERFSFSLNVPFS